MNLNAQFWITNYQGLTYSAQNMELKQKGKEKNQKIFFQKRNEIFLKTKRKNLRNEKKQKKNVFQTLS
jgi:hypothetical protein